MNEDLKVTTFEVIMTTTEYHHFEDLCSDAAGNLIVDVNYPNLPFGEVRACRTPVRVVQSKPERGDDWQWLSNPILGRVRTFILNQGQLTFHVGEEI